MSVRRLAGLFVLMLAMPGFVACNRNSAADGPIIRIYSSLEPNQLSETTTITLGGATQTLSLDRHHPRGYVEFVGDIAGEYPTTFTSTTVVMIGGQPTTIQASGQGSVFVHGQRADFHLLIDTSNRVVFLVNR